MKEQATINEIASQNSVHPNQVRNWKKQLMEEGSAVFERETGRAHQDQEAQEAELYEQIGRLKMELEWLNPHSAPLRVLQITFLNWWPQ